MAGVNSLLLRTRLVCLIVVRNEFHKRFSTFVPEEAKRRITIPSKMVKALDKKQAKNLVKNHLNQPRSRGQVMISCKRAMFNHHSGQTYSDFSPKDLASGGWKHPKSKGDYFTINASEGNPALMQQDENLKVESFSFFGLHQELINGLKAQNITKPTNIQIQTIPLMQNGLNVLCAAETGSGKTLAYLLPMIERVHRYRMLFGATQAPNRPIGVILTPSRELAEQIYSVTKHLSSHTAFYADVKCGGRRTQRLLRDAPEIPVDILVTTPGVFSKLLANKIYDLSRLSHIVLDEADTLLDDSFQQKTIHLIQKLKISSEKPVIEGGVLVSGAGAESNMQIALVSATMPRALEEILGEVVPIDTIEMVTTKHLHRIMPHVAQKFVRLGPSQRPEYLLTQLKSNVDRKIPTIVFCNKTSSANYLNYFLDSNSIKNVVLHADMPQKAREGRFEIFQKGDCDVIVCTDVMSRGLDTIRARHVINFEFPEFMSDYIHRVGRVGRVGSNGACFVVSFICYKWDVDLLWQIESSARRKCELHNVNANIKRKLTGIHKKKMEDEITDVVGN